MSGERGPTPGTAKSSRSPTPAGDPTHCERQRFTFYPGMPMPYIVQCKKKPFNAPKLKR